MIGGFDMKSIVKKKAGLFGLVLSMLLLAGCSGSYGSESMSTVSKDMNTDYDITNGIDYDSSYEDSGFDNESSDFMGSVDSVSKSDDLSSDTNVNSDKIVYTCNINLETLDYDEAYKALKNGIGQFNGFVESEYAQDNDYNWYYEDHVRTGATKSVTITARIPSDKYEDFLDSVDSYGKVTSKNSNADNISREYSDVKTVIRSLEIQETRLLDMMKSADTIQDMISVEDRLTQVQTQLNRYKTQLSGMQSDIDYSTVTVYLKEVAEYTPEVKSRTFIDRLKNTVSDSWDGFKGALEHLLFFMILWIPQLIVYVPALFVIVFVFRKIVRFFKKHSGKSQSRKSQVKTDVLVKDFADESFADNRPDDMSSDSDD